MRLADGEHVPADGGAGPQRALHGWPDPAARAAGPIVRRLRGWRYGLGTFKVDYALAGPAPRTASDARDAAVVRVVRSNCCSRSSKRPQPAGSPSNPR